MRIAYFHSDHPNAVLIRYIGHSTLAAQFPHSNAKSTQRNYTRTQLSILRHIGTASGSARQVYHQQVLAGPPNITDQLASVSRNLEQVRYVRKVIRNRNRLTRDGLYNLHERHTTTSCCHLISQGFLQLPSHLQLLPHHRSSHRCRHG